MVKAEGQADTVSPIPPILVQIVWPVVTGDVRT